MNIYFAASTHNIETNRSRLEKVLSGFEKLGHYIQESWIVEGIKRTKTNLTPQEHVLKNIQLLQEADLVVVELATPSFGVGYLLGQALANRKHVLALYPAELNHNDISEIVTGSTSGLLTLLDYTESDLDKVIRNYLAGIKLDNLRKFNFIVSQEVLDFIESGAKRSGKSKSEFLRDTIQKHLIGK